MKKLWFKNKTYGFGWTPSSWEGWLVTAVYLFVVIGMVEKLARKGALGNIIWIIFATLFFVWVTASYGEKPHWSWGKPKNAHSSKDTKKEE